MTGVHEIVPIEPIDMVIDKLVELLKCESVATLTNAIQLEEVERWQNGMLPLSREQDQLRLAYAFVLSARLRGLSDKAIRNWFIKSRCIYDTEHGYFVTPALAFKYRLRDEVEASFARFLSPHPATPEV